jgi:hypothetical protein
MLQTFKAILTKNQIQWIDEMPLEPDFQRAHIDRKLSIIQIVP